MADQQPEAIRLADALDDMTCIWSPSDNRDLVNSSAAELRRLHAVEIEAIDLRAQVERLQAGGGVVLPERETEAMHDAVMAVLYKGVARTQTNRLWTAYRSALLATPQPSPAPVAAARARCHLCDCTGDIHDATGEWRGQCPHCKAAAPALVPLTLGAVLTYNRAGSPGATGQTCGADGAGEYAFLLHGSPEDCDTAARQHIRDLEACGVRVKECILVLNEERFAGLPINGLTVGGGRAK